MRALKLNTHWQFRHLESDGYCEESWQEVSIPHDAMIGEPRYEQAISGINSGWYEGRDYEYKREISLADIPEEYRTLNNGIYFLEFEGVYQHAQVFLDDTQVAYRPYGYTNFVVDVSEYLCDGASHELRVIARNADQPNSRWYSGAGIYRPVNLWFARANAITVDGLYAQTRSVDGIDSSGRIAKNAYIVLSAETLRSGSVVFEICDNRGNVVATQSASSKNGNPATAEIELSDVMLWNINHPYLYSVHARIEEEIDGSVHISDTAEVEFGIRTVQWSDSGFLINGRRVLIQGACIHHDNGVLGSAAYDDAEWRKVALMQRAGYNALRSAHNPCSKEMLRACDKLGMLMMDEYIDHWYIHKTKFDYVDYFEQWWTQDVTDMVRKDRSHASVVLYSTGNEVSETAQKRGIKLAQEMTDFIHNLDSTRPVTCGINIFFNFLSSIGMGVYSDKKAEAEAENAAHKAPQVDETGRSGKAVGSQFFNDMAGILGADFMKTGATLPMCDWKTKDAFAAMDIAGYNYGIKRYKHDLKKYPHRLILGSETFCADAYKFRELAKRTPRIVGDFVWAGMDYMGEVGVGAWEYDDYAPHPNGFGWRTAGSGRVDLIGQELGEALYTKVALEVDKGPFIAVCPVNHTDDKHSPSAWKMSNAIPSWSWEGYEGRKAKVEVYARADQVALFINGHEVGRKTLRNECIARFTCRYEPGVIEAVTYDSQGCEIGRHHLHSADSDTRIRAVLDSLNGELTQYVSFDREVTKCDNKDNNGISSSLRRGHLAFVRLQYTDCNGIVKPLMRGRLTVEVDEGSLVGLGSAAPFNLDSYTHNETGTYYGQALAVIKADDDAADSVTIRVHDGTYATELTIPVE